MKLLALLGWVAALASLLVAAVLFFDRRPASPATVFDTIPLTTEPHVHLRGVRTVASGAVMKGNPGFTADDLRRRIAATLVAGGRAVVEGPGDKVPDAADGTVIGTVLVDPTANGTAAVLMKVSFKRRDVVTLGGGQVVRSPCQVWNAEQAAVAEGDVREPVLANFERLTTAFCEDVGKANGK